VASHAAAGRNFLNRLPSGQTCTILTVVPAVGTPMGTAKAIAARLGLKFVAPQLQGLMTFDKVHLDPQSAQRWSAAFLEQAGAEIQQCVQESDSQRAARSVPSGSPALEPNNGN
jgi:hypothetical protein